VTAVSTENLLEIVVGGSASDSSAAVAGTFAVIVINPGDHATAASIGDNAVVHAGGNVSVTASDTADKLSIVSGNVAISTSSAGVGASLALLVRSGTVTATIGNGADIEADGSTGLTVSATQTGNVLLVAVAGAGGDSAGIAGSVSVDVLTDTTTAGIGNNTTVNCVGGSCVNSSANATQAVVVTATDTTTILSLAGAVAVGGTAGVGVGLDVEDLHKTTAASIGSSTTVHANGDVVVAAKSSEDIKSISAGVSVGGTAAVTVNAAVPVITVTTTAGVGSSSNVRAGGNVIVSADEAMNLFVIAGNISVGGTAAIGAGVAVPVVTKTTTAAIGSSATVTGLGIGSHITHGSINDGTFTTTGTDTRFDPRGILGGYPTAPPQPNPVQQGVEADGMTINLGFTHHFSEGQQVVYDAGGGAPITGLVNGDTYYVHLVPGCGTCIQIRGPNDSNAPIITGMSLPGGVRMGENQRFIPTNTPGAAGDDAPRFNPVTDTGSNYIVLPYVFSGTLNVGDPVVYSSGGGTAIGGLTDGATYYVVDPSPDHFQIADSKCHATGLAADCNGTAQPVMALTLNGSVATGRSHSFVPSGKLPGADAQQSGPQAITADTMAVNGVAVTATNSDYIASLGVSAGVAGTVAVNLSGSISVLSVHTSATIGAYALVNCASGNVTCSANDLAADPSQSVVVASGNNYRTLGLAASVAVSASAAIGASAAMRVVDLHSDALIDHNAVVNARQNISVTGSVKLTV